VSVVPGFAVRGFCPKEALINSSLNYQSKQNKKCHFCFASFSMICNH